MTTLPIRTNKLKGLLRPNDDEAAVRLKMVDVLPNQPPVIDTLLLHPLNQLDPAIPEAADPVKPSTSQPSSAAISGRLENHPGSGARPLPVV
ncbi:hypothetical protein [Cyanobium gracile]|uniref:Uncharacterized protein n=1 Tax=Cyanobium gracile UHCC 0281 TaxID=3110309 RepID=A0ABU5SZZ3_9CYAN|nr:hypothetical protein [Cyanobium gracile]MEA5444094.1 hypothetical protein [Cyanobium gracile UHCC 0281]